MILKGMRAFLRHLRWTYSKHTSRASPDVLTLFPAGPEHTQIVNLRISHARLNINSGEVVKVGSEASTRVCHSLFCQGER